MKAAVLGLGVMGPGIVATLARGGIDVACYDIKPEQLAHARAEMPTLLEALARYGAKLIMPKQGEIRYEADLGGAVRAAELVVEALPERVEIKHTMFAALDRLAPANAILASTTAAIPITRLQEACNNKGRVVGLNWTAPSHLAPVVEVIAGAHTDARTLATARAIVANLGAQPVLVARDSVGSVQARLRSVLERESDALVADGVIERTELDRLLCWGIGLHLAAAGAEARFVAIRKTIEGR